MAHSFLILGFEQVDEVVQVIDAIVQGGAHGHIVFPEDVCPHVGAAGADARGVPEAAGCQALQVFHGFLPQGGAAGAEGGQDVRAVGNARHGAVVVHRLHHIGGGAQCFPESGKLLYFVLRCAVRVGEGYGCTLDEVGVGVFDALGFGSRHGV